LYLMAFKLGQLVMLAPEGGLPPFEFPGDSFGAWLEAGFDWITTAGKPLLVGIPLLGVLLSIAGYVLVRLGWRCYVVHAWRSRQRARRKGAPHA